MRDDISQREAIYRQAEPKKAQKSQEAPLTGLLPVKSETKVQRTPASGLHKFLHLLPPQHLPPLLLAHLL